MNKVTINPSIAAIVDIDSVGYTETVNVYFTAPVNWVGVFVLTVFNSSQKNTASVVDALTVVDKVITWKIEPKTQGIEDSKYYEIYSANAKRIVFKGNLIIKK